MDDFQLDDFLVNVTCEEYYSEDNHEKEIQDLLEESEEEDL